MRRAGLNEREAPGKVVTARLPTRLAQLRSVSHALVSTLRKHQSKTSKLIRFGSLHYRDNWGWPCTAVRMLSNCPNRKLFHKKWSFCYRDITHKSIFCHTLSDHLHYKNRPFTYVLRKGICLHSLAHQTVHRFEKMFSKKYHAKAIWTVGCYMTGP